VIFPRFNLLVVCLAGRLTRQQNQVIEFLQEENRTLHELLDRERTRLTDHQRWRLAIKARPVSRKVLQQIIDRCSAVGTAQPLLEINLGVNRPRRLPNWSLAEIKVSEADSFRLANRGIELPLGSGTGSQLEVQTSSGRKKYSSDRITRRA